MSDERDKEKIYRLMRKVGVRGDRPLTKRMLMRDYGFTESEAEAFVKDVKDALRTRFDDPVVDRMVNNARFWSALLKWAPILLLLGITIYEFSSWLLKASEEDRKRRKRRKKWEVYL